MVHFFARDLLFFEAAALGRSLRQTSQSTGGKAWTGFPLKWCSGPKVLDCGLWNSTEDGQAQKRAQSLENSALSLGRVFQLHTLCWLQGPFRDIGQNSALRRPVDSATCGPELKQSLGLKSACKEPPNGFKGAP